MTVTVSPVGAADLAVFSDPASVAVVGASEDPAKWGYWLASGALSGAHRRAVHLVNRRGVSVLGQPCAPSLSDLPEVPELVALSVPASHVQSVVEEGLRLGVRGFLGITAGVPGEAELAARIRAHGARLVGANSLGIFDAESQLSLAWGTFTAGSLAIVSQSGQLGSELSILGQRRGLGISRFVSVGNQSDVQAAELLAELAEHEATKVVAVYLESFADGRALFEALRTLREAGKPTLLLTVGASAASSRLARSHTGSLTSTMDVVDAACRAAGVARMSTPGELIDAASAIVSTTLPAGNRVAVVGDSGGQCGIAADVVARSGLTVPAFNGADAEQLSAALPAGAAHTNPVDLAGIGEENLTNYAAITEQLLRSADIDSVILTGYFGCYGVDAASQQEPELAVARQLGEVARRAGKPLIVHSMAPDSATSRTLWECGVPTFGRIEQATAALSALAQLRPPAGLDASPDASVPVEVDVSPGYWAARELLAATGIAFPAGRLAQSRQDVVQAATELEAPYVLKAGWLEHKSEHGGVRVGIADGEALAEEFIEMHDRLGDGDYVVEEMDTRDTAVEILVGARRDPDFGPVIVVGAGGTEAEMLRDTALELAPIHAHTAVTMLERLRCMALLRGWRGAPAVNIDSLAALVAAVSQVIDQHPTIAEIELNPVRVAPDGALAVDALIITDQH